MRCATTWISRCIEHHPALFIPAGVKEIHFFDKIRISPGNSERRRLNYEKGLSWYLSFFKDALPNQLMGEYTPNYFNDAETAGLIAKHFPQAKLILSLRNPIARIRSHHQYVCMNHENIPADLGQVIQDRNEEFLFLENGLYGKNLQEYLNYFPLEQILILFHNDIQSNPVQACQKLYSFLGVDDSYLPPTVLQKINTSRAVKSRVILRSMRFAKQSIKKLNWIRRAADFLGGVTLARWINRLNAGNNRITNSEISPEMLTYLNQYYREDIELLESLTGEDLTKWK